MTDLEWHRLVKAGEDEGWKLVWERVIAPEARSHRSAELMRKYSLTDGDLNGMLYEEMIARGKIDLYRGEGSFAGWLRRYVRGFVLNADPNRHGEVSLERAHPDAEDGRTGMDIPVDATGSLLRNETWGMTHWCFRKLWNADPERCYVHVLKTRFHLSSEETRAFLDISSAANVDQIFSRSVRFMRKAAAAFVLVLAVSLTGCLNERSSARPVRWKVESVSERLRPPVPDGLSGVTRAAGGRFLSIEDSGGRLWTLDVSFDATNAITGCALPSHVALEGVADGEGCAWDPLRKTVWVSDETGPSVSEHDPKTGRRLSELELTDDFRRIRPNRGPEGLTISPDGLTLWTCPEEAVEGDGPLASPTNGTLVRLHRYVRSSGADAWRHAEEIPYRADPFGGSDFRNLSCSGVSGLCALADGTLLVLEREMSVKGFLPSFRLRLYEVHPGKEKRLLLDRDTGLAMYEGICLASEAPDGTVCLLLVSDGDGPPIEALLSITLAREEEE